MSVFVDIKTYIDRKGKEEDQILTNGSLTSAGNRWGVREGSVVAVLTVTSP